MGLVDYGTTDDEKEVSPGEWLELMFLLLVSFFDGEQRAHRGQIPGPADSLL